MKKYKRFLFFAIFLISIIGFVVYRSKYLNLVYTFELGGLFEPPTFIRNCLAVNGSVSRKFDDFNLFSRPINSWIQVNDFHVYSAFLRGESMMGIALAVAEKKVHCPNYKCHVWFSENGHKVSLNGKFKCNVDEVGNSTRIIYEFVCELYDNVVFDAADMFVIIDDKRKFFIPIHYRLHKQKENNSAACVYPDTNAIENISVLEFLSYHHLIGFSDIVIYDSGLQHRTLYLIERTLQSIDVLRSFSVLQWNFPFDDPLLAEEAIRRDCLYRTSGHVELLAFLSWYEYLVPMKNQSALISLMEYKNQAQKMLNVNVKICCIDKTDDLKSSDKSWPMIFRKTVCHPSPMASTRKIILNPDVNSAMDVIDSSPSELYVYEYGICVNANTDTVRDRTLLIYLTSLMESKLLRVWRSGALNEN